MKIKTNSKLVKKGDTFVAIKGYCNDGNDFIKEAIKNGAEKIVTSKLIKTEKPTLIVNDTKKWLENYLVKKYSKKINTLNIIGITGTNGKTTSSFLIYELLNNLQSKTAYIGTIGFFINGKKIKDLSNTTPDILTLYDLLLKAKKENCQNVVMEISSHSLIFERIKGIKLKAAGFTNLSSEHLDFHENMENYLSAKMQILNYLTGKIYINSDDKSYKKWVLKTPNYISYGKNGDFKIIKEEECNNETKLTFMYKNKKYNVLIPLKGTFNVYNYLLALGIVNSFHYPISKIIDKTKNIKAPKGRLEKVNIKNRNIYIDYAHTPDGVLKIMETFKKCSIITVIGCGGQRDTSKRPIMGKLVTKYSKHVIFTNDNPRCEDEKKIMDDITQNLKKKNYEIEYNRKKAIAKALKMSNSNDTILILGKGHEEYQIIGNKKNYFSDYDEVIKYYKKGKITKKEDDN